MIIAITGASGLIGSALTRRFTARGDEVRPLVRRSARTPSEISWDPERGTIDAGRLEGVDAVINLAGENLGQRWSSDVKRRIRDSRVNGTALVARTIVSLTKKPRAFLSGSAIGIYGSRGDEVLDETSSLGDDFLARVCQEWEAAAAPAANAGVRVVSLRTGLVLAAEGGMLSKFLIPFRLGVGGRLGSGKQWMSWIDRDDYARAAELLVSNDSARGPFNMVAPNPVTNEEFTDTLGRVMKRPSLVPAPAFAMKLALGAEMAEETALASQRVKPKRLLELGFEFQQPSVEGSLRSQLRD